MPYTAPAFGRPDPIVLSTATPDLLGTIGAAGNTAISSAWASNNRALFVPVTIAETHTYTTAIWLNGTSVTGNVDVGIGTISGSTWTRIVASTAEAQAGTTAAQIATTFTTTTLTPGLYYLAMSMANTAATVYRMSMTAAYMPRTTGVFQAASSHPLPSSVTVAVTIANFVPLFGFSETAAI